MKVNKAYYNARKRFKYVKKKLLSSKKIMRKLSWKKSKKFKNCMNCPKRNTITIMNYVKNN